MGNQSKNTNPLVIAMRRARRAAHKMRPRGTTVYKGVTPSGDKTYSPLLDRIFVPKGRSKYEPHEGKKQKAKIRASLQREAQSARKCLA
jgi:hypothetical protein